MAAAACVRQVEVEPFRMLSGAHALARLSRLPGFALRVLCALLAEGGTFSADYSAFRVAAVRGRPWREWLGLRRIDAQRVEDALGALFAVGWARGAGPEAIEVLCAPRVSGERRAHVAEAWLRRWARTTSRVEVLVALALALGVEASPTRLGRALGLSRDQVREVLARLESRGEWSAAAGLTPRPLARVARSGGARKGAGRKAKDAATGMARCSDRCSGGATAAPEIKTPPLEIETPPAPNQNTPARTGGGTEIQKRDSTKRHSESARDVARGGCNHGAWVKKDPNPMPLTPPLQIPTTRAEHLSDAQHLRAVHGAAARSGHLFRGEAGWIELLAIVCRVRELRPENPGALLYAILARPRAERGIRDADEDGARRLAARWREESADELPALRLLESAFGLGKSAATSHARCASAQESRITERAGQVYSIA